MRAVYAESQTSRRHGFMPALLCALFTGCGGTTAGIVAALSGNGGSSGSADGAAVLTVTSIEARRSPARIQFTLSDPEANPVNVRLQIPDPADPGRRIDLVLVPDENEGITTELSGLGTSQQGTPHTRLWDFARQDQLGTDALTRGVTVHFSGKEGARDLEPRAATVDVGNDPPVLTITSEPNRSLTGVVSVEFTVFDSQDDRATVEAFYDLLDDDPDQGFLPARGGTASGPSGQPIEFLWNAQSDLGFNDHDVALMLIPSDGIKTGAAAIDLVRVDNNTEPRVEINNAALLLSTDRRGGIPIPFTVFDGNVETSEPGDEVVIVFQWRTDRQPAFPELPPLRNAREARTLLANPELADLRRELQVCTEIPRRFEGRLMPVSETEILLPELAASASAALETDPTTGELRLSGALEILRRTTIPEPISGTLREDPGLMTPVAALPVESGPLALVLEDLGSSWRLRSFNLSTGGNVRLLAQGIDTPTAMTYEKGERNVLVALFQELSDSWEIRRVDLASSDGGPGEHLASSLDGTTEGGRIRGIASLGSETALITAGRSLVKASYPAEEPPRLATLLGPPNTPLAEPWGIAVDPLLPHRIYLAENGRNRILTVRTDRLEATIEVKARGIGVPRPTAIALEKNGTRLLVVTDANPGDRTRELRGIELGSPVDQDGNGRADLEVFEIGRGYSTTSGLGAGADGFRILPLVGPPDLAVAGGVASRTVIERGEAVYDPTTRIVRLDRPLDPAPQRAAPWRLVRTVFPVGSPGGTDGVYVWSSDEASQGSIRIGAVAFDGDRGLPSRSSTSITVRSALDTTPLLLPDPGNFFPRKIVAADLDQDGDLDLVYTNGAVVGGAITIFYQSSPRAFDRAPTILQHPSLSVPLAVAAADLDQDGDVDLVSANGFMSQSFTLFFQTSPGVFDPEPTVLATPSISAVSQVVAADLDQDGDMDLLSADPLTGSSNLTILFQTSPGVFDDENPLVLEAGSLQSPFNLAAADLDQDGDVDIVASATNAVGGARNLTILFQTEPGVFDIDNRVVLRDPALRATTALITADLDQDGDLDLVTANFDPPPANLTNLALFFQTSPGVYDPRATVLRDPSFNLNRLSAISAADLDRDGDLDLVAADDLENKLIVYLQTSPGSFDPVPTTIETSVDGPTSLVAADLDTDGHVDLVTANTNGRAIALYFQSGPGSFDPEPSLLESIALDGPVSVTAADLDRDGDLDLVSANATSDNLTIFAQTSPGVFDAPSVLDGPAIDGPQSVFAADLDQDGDLDLVSANQVSNNLALFFQGSPGIFGSRVLLGDASTMAPSSVVATDLDQDGDLDVVSSNRTSNNLTLFFQTGRGVFDPVPVVLRDPAMVFPLSVAAADLDEDGDTDLVVASIIGDNLTLFFQTSPGVFGAVTVLAAGFLDTAQSVAAADMDGDGDLDLVVAARSRASGLQNLVVLFQSSPGNFLLDDRVVIRPSALNLTVAVAVADVDGDGDADLVASGTFASRGGILIFRQATPRSFDPVPVLLDLNAVPQLVTVADLDQDGDLDLVAPDLSSDRLAVFFSSD